MKARGDGQFSFKEKLGRKAVLSQEQEKELVSVLLDMEKRLFGVGINDVKKYVFQYCEKNKIPNPFNRNKSQAGRDWFLYKTPEKSGNSTAAEDLHSAPENNTDGLPETASPSFRDLIPIPVKQGTIAGTRKRRVAHSTILTESPYIHELE